MILAGKYVLNEKMGEGAHGIVRLVCSHDLIIVIRKASILNTSNNNFVALKSVKLNTLEHPIDGKRLVREIALLRVCRHKNVI
jgi:serine/threonine protein kinase